MSRHSPLTTAAKIHAALVVGVVAWGALSFGAVYPWGYRPLAVACLMAGTLGLLSASARRRVPTAVAVAFAVVMAAVVLQQIQVPRQILTRISPATVNLLTQYDVLFAAPAADQSHALSVDPNRTWTGLWLLVSLGTFCLGLMGTLNERVILRIVRSIVVLGLGMAVLAILQPGGEHGKVYGFWQSQSPSAPFGPFINRNHYAGWMLMSVLTGLGYFVALMARAAGKSPRDWRARLVWLSSRPGSRLILLGFALTVMTLSVLLSMSRSGIACLALGLATFGAVATRKLLRSSRGAVVAAYLVVVVSLCVGFVGADRLSSRFGELGDDSWRGRLGVWSDARAVIRTFPLAGTGFNTFSVAMLFYQTGHLQEFYAEAHNDYLQLAAEGGLLIGLPVVGLILVTSGEVRRRLSERTDTVTVYWIRAGATLGLLAIALQETSEFSLQMPGNAALFCVLVAIVLHRSADLATR